MELERKFITLNHGKGRAVSQLTLEEDLNVPDQKPDIFRIVHRQGEFCPDEIKGEAGKVKVRGMFVYRILYIGEGNGRMPDILEGSIPVDETIFLNELEEGDTVDFRWNQEDLHASAIHSRKANIKSVLSLTAEAFREQPVPLVEKPEETKDLYLRTCPVRLQQEVIHKKDTLRVREDLNLPPGRPNIRRLIWKEMRLQNTEVRQDEGKLVVKGELVVFFLYESEEDGALQWIEQGIPFRNEVECDVCRADLAGKSEATLLRAELELQPDYDGEPRTVRVEAVLELLMRYFEDRTCEVLCDAYSLSREILPERRTYLWDHVRQVSDSRARVSGRMKLSEAEAGVMQILSTGAQIHGDYVEKTEKGLLIQGSVELWVLYATADDAQPLACASDSFPFEHTVELQKDSEECSWQIFLCLDQLMAGMLDARELEMKAVLQAQVLFGSAQELELVEELAEEPLDMERIRRLPGMVIHVVQPGETLWDIAKSHAATCRSVEELNGLKDDALKPGSKLLLVKETAGKREDG
ncbi:MAG: DUF3794 domain-containing protein [Eubacteriales bacterium]|nr:DUF3794 domain-containing protein [Eubacteriales bacterium]